METLLLEKIKLKKSSIRIKQNSLNIRLEKAHGKVKKTWKPRKN